MNEDPIAIIAFDKATMERVGEFESIKQAARKLFIRSDESIRGHLFGKKGGKMTRQKRGVKSYKDDKLYVFQVKEKES